MKQLTFIVYKNKFISVSSKKNQKYLEYSPCIKQYSDTSYYKIKDGESRFMRKKIRLLGKN